MIFRCLFLMLIVISLESYSQEIKIKGVVKAFKTYPLNKVKIKGNKLKKEVYTDSLGRFEIRCLKNEKLTFSAEGFFRKEKKIKTELPHEITVNLNFDENSKQASIDAVNLSHLKKEALNYCLDNLRSNNNKYQNLIDIFEVIQYEYPQARIAEVNGTNQILLIARGEKSLNADRHALLVVEGIVTSDIGGISPYQVKNVNIIQGHETSLWGMQGSNGVVVIDLK